MGSGIGFGETARKMDSKKTKKNKEKSESKARWKSSIQSSPLPSDNESMSGSDDEEYRPHARQVEIPSHNTDFAGPLGREMLERYSRKKKAKYNGGFLNRTPTLNELRDT
ncbi:MAG TPA: hypothetical protein VF427_00385, partial [Noviherbaspirillum sp.]